MSVQRTTSPMTNSWSVHHKVSPVYGYGCVRKKQQMPVLLVGDHAKFSGVDVELPHVANKLEEKRATPFQTEENILT